MNANLKLSTTMDQETFTTTVACPQLPLLQLAMMHPREFGGDLTSRNVSYNILAYRYFIHGINLDEAPSPAMSVAHMELLGAAFLAACLYDWQSEASIVEVLRDLYLPGMHLADEAMFAHDFVRFRSHFPHSSLYNTGRSILKCKAAYAKLFHNAFCIYSSMGGVNEQDVTITIVPDSRTITVTSTSQGICRNAVQDLRFALSTALAGPYSDYIERHIALYNGTEVDPAHFLDDGRTFPQYLNIY